MTQQQAFAIGRIVVADQTLKVAEPVWLWLPNTQHLFEGYVTFRDGDVAHVWVGPFKEQIRRPNGPLDQRDPHAQIAFWNGGAWDTDLEKSPDDDRYPIAMDFCDMRAVLCRLEVPEHDEEALRDRLGVPLPYYDHGRHDFGPI